MVSFVCLCLCMMRAMHTIVFLMSQSLTVALRTSCLVFSNFDIDEWRSSQASIPILGVETMFKPKRLVIIWYVDVLHNWGLLEMTRALPRCPKSRLMNGRAVCWVCWAVSCFAAVTQITEIYWNSNWHSSPPMVILWRTPRGQKPDFLSQEGFLVWLRWAWYCIHTTCNNDKLS